MSIRVNPRGRVNGLRAVILENDWMLLSILPEVGGKIYDLFWKPTNRELLWHNPRIAPQMFAVDANFDNYWCGGWDDGFPTCDACNFQGERLPLLGELRSLRWKVESVEESEGNAIARLSAFGPISPVRAVKTVKLASDGPIVRMRFEVENIGPLPQPFMWGTHPALEVNDRMILRIPARTGIVGQATAPEFGVPGQRYAWPKLDTANGITDMSRVRGIDAKVACGHYATDLSAGWYAVEDMAIQEGFLIQFPVETCPYLWLWMVYGGWRGYHHLIVEPWTSYPNNLTEAFEHGTSHVLIPGESFSVEVSATVYSGGESYQRAIERLSANSEQGS